MTLKKAERDLKKLLANELPDKDIRAIDYRLPGGWTQFIERGHDGQSSLGEYKNYLAGRNGSARPFTSYLQDLVGIDSTTERPAEYIPDEVDPGQTLEITVPDRYLENPPRDPSTRKPLWLVPSFNAAALETRTIILRAQHTHRRKNLANATVQAPPPQGGLYEDFYKAVRQRFRESGMVFNAKDAMLQLTGDGPHEMHGARKIDFDQQTLHAPKRMFEGLLSHRLGAYAPPLARADPAGRRAGCPARSGAAARNPSGDGQGYRLGIHGLHHGRPAHEYGRYRDPATA